MAIILIVVLIAFVAGAAMMSLWQSHQSLKERVAKLESANRRRLPYRSMEEIEDAIAAIDKLIYEVEFDKSLLDNAMAHLHKARNPIAPTE